MATIKKTDHDQLGECVEEMELLCAAGRNGKW